jgi:hypothetical protein
MDVGGAGAVSLAGFGVGVGFEGCLLFILAASLIPVEQR